MSRITRPRVDVYQVPVRAADPRAIGMAQALGALFIRGINGHAGRIRYGYPQIGMRNKYQGYGAPPQLFLGYDPAKVAAGSFRGSPNHLPATNTAGGLNALQASMAAVTASQMGQAV